MTNVIDIRARLRRAPTLGDDSPSDLVRRARAQAGLSVTEFADALRPLLGWRPRPGWIRLWESGEDVPADVLEICRCLLTDVGGASPAASASPHEAPDLYHAAADDELAEALSVAWGSTPVEVARTVTGLFRADLGRREAIASLATVALSEPLARWLLDPADRDVARLGGRQVGQADVDAVWSMCGAFADTDHRLGGGHARRTLICYADEVVAPLLSRRYTDQTGRRLFAAAARLCDVAGFMCFDSGAQGLGQRYFTAALRMAKISGDPTLGAHILTDMSMQAQHLRQIREAVDLADAGVAAAARSGSASTLARGHAIRSRALALSGQAGASDHALNQAERVLDQADPRSEPSWIRFFTPQQLSAEAMYAAAGLQRNSLVRRHAADVLTAPDAMQRRQVLATATLAGSYLPSDNGASDSADVEQACEVLRGALPVLASQTSARALGLVTGLRGRLARYSHLTAVQELEQALQQSTIGAGS